jgi:hypothetical protein
MIIFDLATLADDTHRRHFIDSKHYKNTYLVDGKTYITDGKSNFYTQDQIEAFKPNWQAYYDACDKDESIGVTITLINQLLVQEYYDIQIWTGQNELTKNKIVYWLKDELDVDEWFYRDCLIMRPIGNTEPDHVLKEKWLDELITTPECTPIEMVFDSDPESIAMWRRRGIFCFDCRQE